MAMLLCLMCTCSWVNTLQRADEHISAGPSPATQRGWAWCWPCLEQGRGCMFSMLWMLPASQWSSFRCSQGLFISSSLQDQALCFQGYRAPRPAGSSLKSAGRDERGREKTGMCPSQVQHSAKGRGGKVRPGMVAPRAGQVQPSLPHGNPGSLGAVTQLHPPAGMGSFPRVSQ